MAKKRSSGGSGFEKQWRAFVSGKKVPTKKKKHRVPRKLAKRPKPGKKAGPRKLPKGLPGSPKGLPELPKLGKLPKGVQVPKTKVNKGAAKKPAKKPKTKKATPVRKERPSFLSLLFRRPKKPAVEKKEAGPALGEVKQIKQVAAKPPAEMMSGGPVIETSIDKLYDLILEKGKLSTDAASAALNVKKEIVENWAQILAEHGLVELSYPSIGKIVMAKKKAEE
jgi:hypothetical protein